MPRRDRRFPDDPFVCEARTADYFFVAAFFFAAFFFLAAMVLSP
jgi:hypothetical protein